MNWKKDFSKSITTYEALESLLTLTDSEEAWFQRAKGEPQMGLPFRISPLFMREILKNTENPNYPLRIQSIPRIEETTILPYESNDPLCEDKFSPFPMAVHRYPSRLLLYAGTQCAHYCRHCFRRHLPSAGKGESLSQQHDALLDYLNKHDEIDEILLSGGDFLLSSDKEIARLLEIISGATKKRTIRLCSRIPIVLPSRITPKLINILKKSRPLWLVTHINHPDELTPEALEAIARFQNARIPVLSQSVLLKGVNDDYDTLKKFFTLLVSHSIKPYYLFQGDLATGTSHLRASLSKGLELMEKLRGEMSSLALPTYALDLPNGGGRLPQTNVT